MSQGFAVHVAVTTTDCNSYPDSHPLFPGALQDQSDIARLFDSFLNVETLPGAMATADNVLDALYHARTEMAAGDTLVFSYAGHGGYIPDHSGNWEPEYSVKCLTAYDRFILGSELQRVWREFEPGRKILVIIDSCFCGALFSKAEKYNYVTGTPLPKGVSRNDLLNNLPGGPYLPGHGSVYSEDFSVKYVNLIASGGPKPVVDLTRHHMVEEYQRLRQRYDSLRDKTLPGCVNDPRVPVIGMFACSGDEQAGILDSGESVFSMVLSIVGGYAKSKNPAQTYREVADNVYSLVIKSYVDNDKVPQIPQFVTRGPHAETAAFASQIAFEP